MRARTHFFVVGLAALVLAGCGEQGGVPFGTVRVRLTDTPAAFDAVNVVVTEVSIHRAIGVEGAPPDTASAVATSENAAGWEVLKSDTTAYDLLALRNRVFTTLATALVPAGMYTQIRLAIGAGSTVVVDGVPYPLEVPSGAQSGLKLVHPFTVPPNGFVDVTLDFDAEQSVVETGAGAWMLTPVIQVTSATGAPSPSGTSPASAARAF